MWSTRLITKIRRNSGSTYFKQIKRSNLIFAAVIVSVITIALSYNINFIFGNIILGYLLINIAYSIYLKKKVIIDVMIIALGFYLRILAGGVVINVYPSI